MTESDSLTDTINRLLNTSKEQRIAESRRHADTYTLGNPERAYLRKEAEQENRKKKKNGLPKTR